MSNIHTHKADWNLNNGGTGSKMTMPTTKSYQYFATIQDGEVCTFARGYPPQELLPNQFELTSEEFKFLQAIEGDVRWAYKQIKAIKAKIKANGA